MALCCDLKGHHFSRFKHQSLQLENILWRVNNIRIFENCLLASFQMSHQLRLARLGCFHLAGQLVQLRVFLHHLRLCLFLLRGFAANGCQLCLASSPTADDCAQTGRGLCMVSAFLGMVFHGTPVFQLLR